jgi:hypothetical protein
LHFKTKKKGGKFFSSFYGCFLRISNPTMAIAMIMAIVAPTMYIIRSVVVATDVAAVTVGAGDVAAVSTAKLVSAYDGQ